MVPSGYRRLFIALPVPKETGKKLDPYCVPHPDARWIPAANRHLTLTFLGHHTEEQTHRAIEVINRIDAAVFEITLHSLQRFPDDRGRNIVALPVDCIPLKQLHEQVASALTTRGFTLKQRDFRPHITLGKIHRGNWATVDISPPIVMAVKSATLFETAFIDGGATYHPLATQPLR